MLNIIVVSRSLRAPLTFSLESRRNRWMLAGGAAALVAAIGLIGAGIGHWVAGAEAALEPLPDRLGLGAGKVYQPIRVAITGTTVSPGIFESVAALGREETLARIDAAIGRIASDQGHPA